MNIPTRQILSKLSLAALIAIATLGTACKKNEPVKPENELEHKHHEEPTKIVISLTEATLAEGKDFAFANLASISDKAPVNKQSFTYEQKADGSWGYAGSTQPQFTVKTITQSPQTVYRLELNYYAPDGDDMNGEFIEEGQDRLHQHFLCCYKGTQKRQTSNLPYEYIYADLDEKGQLLAEQNPIGLRGYVRFRELTSPLELRMELFHASISKYVPGTTAHPFYHPSAELVNTSELDASIPLVFRP